MNSFYEFFASLIDIQAYIGRVGNKEAWAGYFVHYPSPPVSILSFE